MDQVFSTFFQSNNLNSILITSHENADPDALCSAFAMKSLIQILYPDIKIAVSFDGINIVAQKIVAYFSLELSPMDTAIPDGTIIVDTNSIGSLGRIKTKCDGEKPILLLDHHVPDPNTRNLTHYTIIDDKTTATAELVFDLFQALHVTPPIETANLIFLGILSDSRHLLLATNKTIRIINQLLEYGVIYSEIIEILTTPMDRSERIARLKAGQRTNIYDFNGWIVALSHTSSFEASASRGLSQLGADVALVYAETKDGIRISGRANSTVLKATNLNLATDIMAKIAPIMHGEGGGHRSAAGCNGKDNLDEALQLALKLLEEVLTKNR